MENKKLSAEGQNFESSLDMCVCTHIRRAARAITRLYDDALNDTGIRYTQMIILIVLHRCGEITVSRLADELLMDASTVARNMRPLERQGLLVIKKGQDRRQRLISLSDEGVETVLKGLKYWQVAQNKFLSTFSKQQLQSHLAAISELVDVARGT